MTKGLGLGVLEGSWIITYNQASRCPKGNYPTKDRISKNLAFQPYATKP